ncbi:MAG: NADH-quinone oxidoreductase subunit L [Chloroflexota bacterium]|nr:NADH-quinone oxidoreductase subunit L [Chloroflexota bacterium]
MMESSTLIAILAVVIPIIGGPFCYVVEKISPKARTIYAITLGFITAGLTLSLIPSITEGSVNDFLWIPGANISLGICLDSLSVFVAIIAGCIGALALLYSIRYMKHAEHEYSLSRYYWQTLFFIGGMIGLALTSNLLVMYIFWEIIGFCSYALIGYYYHDPEPIPAGTKAFIVTRIGDIGFLAGILILWHATGSLNVFEIMNVASTVSPVLLGLAGAGFIAGAVGKSAQFPLHVWLPDAMVAPTTITSLIHAACLVNAGVYLLARSYPIFMGLAGWSTAILWIGTITAFLAATIALTEWDIKRVLAYSTISQLGYMMAAIGAGAILASKFYLLSHGIFKALLFLCAGAIIYVTGTKDMREMGGLRKHMKITHICAILGLLSLVGIPVLTGFFSKHMILAHLHAGGLYEAFALLAITAFLTAAYSWRMYWLTFQGDRRSKVKIHEAPWQMTVPLIVLAAASLLFWLYISPYTASMASSLPHYSIAHITLGNFIQHAFAGPTIWITVGVAILIALLTIKWKATVINAFRKPSALTLPLMKAYWFDIFYNKCVRGLFRFWQQFRRIQTGDLNYNNLGIVIGFVIFLVLLLVWTV